MISLLVLSMALVMGRCMAVALKVDAATDGQYYVSDSMDEVDLTGYYEPKAG